MSRRRAQRMLAPALKPTARWIVAGLAVLGGMAGAGCGSSPVSSSSVASASSTGSSSSSSSTGGSTGTSGATTGTSSGPALPGTGKPQVTIGDKNYTEQFVLGELYRLALEAQGYSVQLNQNIGPTDVTLQALKSGTLAMYPEYLNAFNSSVAGYSRTFRSRDSAYAAAQRYAGAHGLHLLGPTPFSDTVAIGVTVGYAQANRLRSLSDLPQVSSALTIGGPPQFQQSTPGLPSIERAYGFTSAAFKTIAVGSQYAALDDGSVQAAYMGTTDGQLASGDYKLLDDPGNVFGWGNVVPVVSASAAAAEGPAFTATIERISALLTISVMRQLNQAVDVANQDPAVVAQQFLETHGVIPPAPQ